ncbi:MAG: hypothetical protein KJ650_00805 [Firmicutes bacterium]|nr:hypothetical protein [Bacillota bacterium]MBV1727310.1 hypothetical protein [Desulforudis sp.]MBV1736417.1 hypothetical protein [Desulforudis sp.]
MTDEKRLLTDEHPLIVLPSLAQAVGLNEAIILQQIYYWLQIARKNGTNFRDGHHWTYNTVQQWHDQFPFWGKNTVWRGLHSLERRGLIVTGCFNKLGNDRTKWYRIDFEKLQSLIPQPFTQNGVMPFTQFGVMHLPNLGQP